MSHSSDKAKALQCVHDLLSYFGGSDAVDDRVETARKEQVHGAEENPNGFRETVSDAIRQESCEYDGQTDTHDYNVGDAGMKRFDTWLTRTQHGAEYDDVGGSDYNKVSYRDEEHCQQPNQVVDGDASTGQLH